MRQLENGGHAQSWLYGDGDDDRTRNEAMAVHDRLADKYADKQARSAEAQRRLEEERGLHAPLTGGSRYRRCVTPSSVPSPSAPSPLPASHTARTRSRYPQDDADSGASPHRAIDRVS